MDTFGSRAGPTPAQSAARAGSAGRRRARLVSGRRLSGAVPRRLRAGMDRRHLDRRHQRRDHRRQRAGTTRVPRLKEFWEMVSSPVSWNPVDAGRARPLAVQRDHCRHDRDLRRARLLHAADSAGAAVAARQPAVAELLRHRTAEEDAGAAGRLRSHQRPEDPAVASARSASPRAISAISTITSSRSSARRSARSTSWPPAPCRRAFRPS